jgi:hypothetical protein
VIPSAGVGWWDQIWRDKTEDWVCDWLAPSQVPGDALSGEVEPESSYLSIFLKSARIVDVRKGLTTFYGVVHSYIKLPQRSTQDAEFNVVTTPAALKNIDAEHIDRVIQVNQRLLGPVPYLGGDLEIEVGLFSVAASDLAAPYLSLLEQLSRTAGVSFVSAALPFASPIIEGVKLLSGNPKQATLEVGLSMTQERPRQGYLVVIRAPKEDIDLKDVRVDPADFRLSRNGQPLGPYPYMVFELRSNTQRSDWAKIPELAAAYQEVQSEYRAGRADRVQEALLLFHHTALTCNDLLPDDAQKLSAKVEAAYREVGPPTPVRRGSPGSSTVLPDLGRIGLYG